MGEQVAPSDLRDHRLSHRFLGPGCLCPLKTESRPTFTEAAIFVARSGSFAGQYVAECARGDCGYFGKYITSMRLMYDDLLTVNDWKVVLGDMYNKMGVQVQKYASRGRPLRLMRASSYLFKLDM